MPKSIRLDPQLEENLDRASRSVEMTHSEFIRDAVAKRCEEVLGVSLYDRLAGSLGTIKSAGGRAKQSGQAFKMPSGAAG